MARFLLLVALCCLTAGALSSPLRGNRRSLLQQACQPTHAVTLTGENGEALSFNLPACDDNCRNVVASLMVDTVVLENVALPALPAQPFDVNATDIVVSPTILVSPASPEFCPLARRAMEEDDDTLTSEGSETNDGDEAAKRRSMLGDAEASNEGGDDSDEGDDTLPPAEPETQCRRFTFAHADGTPVIPGFFMPLVLHKDATSVLVSVSIKDVGVIHADLDLTKGQTTFTILIKKATTC